MPRVNPTGAAPFFTAWLFLIRLNLITVSTEFHYMNELWVTLFVTVTGKISLSIEK